VFFLESGIITSGKITSGIITSGVGVDQWVEMSKEMQDALEQENKAKDAIEKLEKENEAKMPKEMWKSNPTSEELAAEYDQWRHATQKEHAEWEKSLEDIPEKQDMEALSQELAKCPCPWEHMDA
jgi:hypothetical protein